jgi:hypothetical protein
MNRCGRCFRSIVWHRHWVRGWEWTHVGADGSPWRTCRAASYTSERGWDETIPRSWTVKRVDQ